jgi:dienelactone hydrolase
LWPTIHPTSSFQIRDDRPMAEIVLFHHALGVTHGVQAFADDLRSRGNIVHVPDLFDGKTFTELEAGVAYARGAPVDERVEAAIEALPNEIVYAGWSLGVMAAQRLAQTRPGSRGALLISSAVAPEEFGGPWPAGVPLQMHMMENDEWAKDYDIPAAREIVAKVKGAELFLYPGDGHLIADSSAPDYDEKAALLLQKRVLEFLDKTR